MLIHDYLFRTASVSPSKLALVSAGERLTYSDLAARTHALAGTLLARGLVRGDRVVIFLENSPEAVVSIFGVLAAGGCFVVVNPGTTSARLADILTNAEPLLIITTASLLPAVEESKKAAGIAARTLLWDGGEIWTDTDHLPQVAEDDLAAIIYTSGSTGKPKGVTHLHSTIVPACESIAEYLDHTADDVILSFLPLASSYGLLQVFVTFMAGGTVVLKPRFGMAYDLIKCVEDEHVTGFAGSPTVYAILLRLGTVQPESIATLRYITNAAAAMPPSFVPKLRKLFPKTKIFLMHGQTECLRTTYLPPDEIDTRTTSVGNGMKNVELWLEDGAGNRLGPGVIGEMVVRGPCVMTGYWKSPQETAGKVKPGRNPNERVLHTGDLFRLDQDGYFHFVSRADEILKVKGEKVSPQEVEEAIYQLDGVAEARVIGVPHEIFGQAIRAEIVLLPGRVLTADEVRTHCKSRLEDFKVPHIVAFVDSLPKTESGKIKRVPSPTV